MWANTFQWCFQGRLFFNSFSDSSYSPSHIYLTVYSSQTHPRSKYTTIVLRRLSKVRWNKLLIFGKYLFCMGFNVENWYFCCSLLPSESLITVIMVQSIKSSCTWGDIMSILNLLLQLFGTFDDIYLLVCCFLFFISLLKVKTIAHK